MEKNNKYNDEKMPTELVRRIKPKNMVSKEKYDKLSACLAACEDDNRKLRKKVKKQSKIISDALETLDMYEEYIEECKPYLPWIPDEQKNSCKNQNNDSDTTKNKKPELRILNADGENIISKEYIEKRRKVKTVVDGATIQLDPYAKTLKFGIHTREVKR